MAHTLTKGTIIGDFTLVEELTRRGGMAQIFLAHRNNDPTRQVALKISRSGQNGHQAFKDLLKLESERLCLLRHPGIVRIYPMDIHGDIQYAARANQIEEDPWYFVMEHIDGEPFVTERLMSFSLNWRIELFYQLLIIVDYMHLCDCAHGDLKPENILFRQPPQAHQTPSIVLIDFGTASGLDKVGPELGASPQYASPELLAALTQPQYPRDLLIPEKMDIWALGAILFELMTGRRLIPDQKVSRITSRLRGQLDRISDLVPNVPPSLDKLLNVMLQRDPARRPPIKDVITAIEEKIAPLRPPRIGTEQQPERTRFRLL